ncbi:MAG: hypothetical protein AAB573_00125 [Patescibacteria group bacterium]
MHSARPIIALAVAILVIVAGWFVLTYFKPTNLHALALSALDKSATDQLLANRTIVDFGYNRDGTISYTYLAEPLPERLAENEVPELRTENSYTKFNGVIENGLDQKIQLTSVFYSQPTFAQDEDGTWRYLEYATTTQESFRNRDTTLLRRITEVLVHTAYADSISPFSEAGDGYVSGLGGGVNATESTCLNNAWSSVSGSTADAVGATMVVSGTISDFNEPPWQCDAAVDRSFTPFDTSAMPGGSTVTAATLNVYVTATVDEDNDGTDYITVQQTSQATHTTLVAADYDNMSAEGIDSGQRKDITSISTSAYLVFTLNSTGMGWVKGSGQASNCSATAGISCFGLVEGHDITGSRIATFTTNSVSMRTSEQAGTTQDPYLEVTYTVAASSAVQTGIKVGGGGGLRVVGGKLKMQ